MTEYRTIDRIVEPQHVTDGAGVHLRRSIASRALDYIDPFLLLDEFKSDRPDDYIAGFPMHPHRGIETVTYMIDGAMRHRDTLGNAGVIEGGDIQWMTAGAGIMHKEMPEQKDGLLFGFQLWVNLPAKNKMMPPRYQDIRADQIPEIVRENGTQIKVIAGTVDDTRGPVTQVVANPVYLDVTMPSQSRFSHPITRGHTAIAYAVEGRGTFDGGETQIDRPPQLIVFKDGDEVRVHTGNESLRFLLISGKPLHEPVARYGPFVMNTQQEIRQALEDLRNNTFVYRG